MMYCKCDVRGVCQEMMWSASVLLRARSVSRNE